MVVYRYYFCFIVAYFFHLPFVGVSTPSDFFSTGRFYYRNSTEIFVLFFLIDTVVQRSQILEKLLVNKAKL
jgi:hypothetical protein